MYLDDPRANSNEQPLQGMQMELADKIGTMQRMLAYYEGYRASACADTCCTSGGVTYRGLLQSSFASGKV
jgi:hypothetical protein